jgi:hypothetical protein
MGIHAHVVKIVVVFFIGIGLQADIPHDFDHICRLQEDDFALGFGAGFVEGAHWFSWRNLKSTHSEENGDRGVNGTEYAATSPKLSYREVSSTLIIAEPNMEFHHQARVSRNFGQ